MARAAIDCSIGDGKHTYFWYDRRIRGQSAANLAPDLLAFVSPKKALLMTVVQARQNNVWISALKGTILVPAIVQFVHLWLVIQNAPLSLLNLMFFAGAGQPMGFIQPAPRIAHIS
jgi:hypothetical protein